MAEMNDRELVKQALEKVVGDREPGIDHLVDAVPEIMARAAREREEAGGMIVYIPLFRWAIPRLSFAAAALVLLAAILFVTSPVDTTAASDTADSTETMEALMLGKNGREFDNDLILNAVVGPGERK